MRTMAIQSVKIVFNLRNYLIVYILSLITIISLVFIALNYEEGKTLMKNPNKSNMTVKARPPVQPDFDFIGVSQEDPRLIEYIQRYMIKPPATGPYKFANNQNDLDFSEFGQSLHADKNYFHGMKGGFFIEVGAGDGQRGANSLYFERDFEWQGILIEPSPGLYKQLITRNRKAYTINAALAISDNASIMSFRKRDNEFLSSFDKGEDTIKVVALPLYSIMKAMNRTVIDFFTLDIESFEVKVLKTIPWDKVTFNIIVIEINHIPEGEGFLRGLLEGKGYKFIGYKGVDAWFGWPPFLDKIENNQN